MSRSTEEKSSTTKHVARMRKVLDAWALMTWIMEEAAAEKVNTLLNQAAAGEIELIMSMINVGEVYYSLAKQGRSDVAEQLLGYLPTMPIRTVVPSRDTILNAAKLKARFPVSYADTFALATATEETASLVTGDRELRIFKAHPRAEQGEAGKQGFADIEWIGD